MANHASAKKAARRSVQKSLVNKNRLSRIKTYIKKVLVAITSDSKESAIAAFSKAQSEIMCGVTNKVLKLNNASRKISRLAKKIKALD